MDRNYWNEKRPVCGYGSCPCRGVHFIVGGGPRNDSEYCVDGVRVRIDEDGTIRRATPEQADKLMVFFAAEHAEYVKWHGEMAEKNRDFMPPLSPARILHYTPEAV